MGTHIIKMPDIGEGIAEVELVAWHVQVGDTVAEDQTLADVMTDKATVEIPSPVAGTVVSLGGVVGQVMAVGSEVIRIEVSGEGNERKAAVAAAVGVAAPVPVPPDLKDDLTAPVVAVADAAPDVAAKAPVTRAEPAKPTKPAAPAVDQPGGERPIASPAVRRRAWELGIDLRQVAASGPAGRIVQADLDAAATTHVAAPAAPAALVAPAAPVPPATPRSSPSSPSPPSLAQRDGEEAIAITGLRRKIAQKMQEAKRRIPHFTYVEEIDATDLELLRGRLNARWGAERGRLTLLPLLMRALVQALREFPQINARFDDEAGVVTRHAAVHIGIATQTGAGLMVPVVRHAEALDLWRAAAEVARLAEAARGGKATRDELGGSTITITSLGALGGIVSTPVINRPEVAIVGVNRMVERPVVRGGAVVVRQMMNLSSSFDHRVVDGMHAAEFVQALRGLLECPALLFVE